MVHEGKWQLVRTGDGEFLAIPPTMDMFKHMARGPDVGTAA
jgi:hypothetical protein